MKRIVYPLLAPVVLALTLSGCTGGQETTADTVKTKSNAEAAQERTAVNAPQTIASINPAIPIYPGIVYRADLSERDAVMVRQQFGPNAEVFTLATDDSFPQVWHYYVTYLAQFRNFTPPSAYPSERQQWRTLQVNLNDAMQDPFIPGNALVNAPKKVVLQLAETEAEPPTVVRYIVMPPNAVTAAPQVAVNHGGDAPTAVAAQPAAGMPGEAAAQ